jgi:hypothetical protein
MQRFSFIAICLVLFMATSIIHAQDEETLSTYTRDEQITHQANEFNGVEVHNQHGDVSVTGWLKDTILVEIKISVKAEYREMADEVLDRIRISKTKLKGLAYMRTAFGEEFHSNYPFRINYEIFMPADKQLIVNNRFGNIAISDLTGNLEITSEYGDVVQQGMQVADTVFSKISFGEADFTNIDYAEIELYNSNVKISSIETGAFSGQYCQADITKAGKVQFSTQTARINMEEVRQIDIKGQFCFVSINQITQRGNIEISDGLLITSLSETAKELSVSNFNAPANISLSPSLAYTLHGEVTNGQFRHDREKHFKVIEDLDKTSFSGEYNANGKAATIILFNKNAGINIKTQK